MARLTKRESKKHQQAVSLIENRSEFKRPQKGKVKSINKKLPN